jgi:MFS family permease
MKLTNWLQNTNKWTFSVYAIVASFCTYSCMYAFRKPFAVATFSDLSFWGIDYKILLITAQVLGYTLSKFIGIKVVSEMAGAKRALSIVVLIGLAGLALLGFALVPAPYNIVFLFLNGLPLGMVWGLVFSYLEGRQTTEILGAGLSISFIFSSGFVKTIGKYVMLNWSVNEYWMPLVIGLLFAIPLIIFVLMLQQIPPPSAEDERLRTKREPMNRTQRRQFLRTFAGGITLLVLAYILLTAFRDFRDNFAAELWNALGYGDTPAIFTLTEVPIALCVLIVMGLLMFIKDNRQALATYHVLIALGFALVGGSTLAFERGWLSAPIWMTLAGLGLYLGYVPFNSILFDRLLATFRYVGTAGFLIYVADSFGYLGSVGVLFYKNFGQSEISWLQFFIRSSYVITFAGSGLMLLALLYFQRKQSTWQSAVPSQESVPTVATERV